MPSSHRGLITAMHLTLGLPDKSIKKLQYIQNSAAKVLTNTTARQHITLILHTLQSNSDSNLQSYSRDCP